MSSATCRLPLLFIDLGCWTLCRLGKRTVDRRIRTVPMLDDHCRHAAVGFPELGNCGLLFQKFDFQLLDSAALLLVVADHTQPKAVSIGSAVEHGNAQVKRPAERPGYRTDDND